MAYDTAYSSSSPGVGIGEVDGVGEDEVKSNSEEE